MEIFEGEIYVVFAAEEGKIMGAVLAVFLRTTLFQVLAKLNCEHSQQDYSFFASASLRS